MALFMRKRSTTRAPRRGSAIGLLNADDIAYDQNVKRDQGRTGSGSFMKNILTDAFAVASDQLKSEKDESGKGGSGSFIATMIPSLTKASDNVAKAAGSGYLSNNLSNDQDEDLWASVASGLSLGKDSPDIDSDFVGFDHQEGSKPFEVKAPQFPVRDETSKTTQMEEEDESSCNPDPFGADDFQQFDADFQQFSNIHDENDSFVVDQNKSMNFEFSVSRFDASVAQLDFGKLKTPETPEAQPALSFDPQRSGRISAKDDQSARLQDNIQEEQEPHKEDEDQISKGDGIEKCAASTTSAPFPSAPPLVSATSVPFPSAPPLTC